MYIPNTPQKCLTHARCTLSKQWINKSQVLTRTHVVCEEKEDRKCYQKLREIGCHTLLRHQPSFLSSYFPGLGKKGIPIHPGASLNIQDCPWEGLRPLRTRPRSCSPSWDIPFKKHPINVSRTAPRKNHFLTWRGRWAPEPLGLQWSSLREQHLALLTLFYLPHVLAPLVLLQSKVRWLTIPTPEFKNTV